ncbi:nucleotidyltransferase domain-containing protein [Halocalculus aciditolerans]|uniref:Nucleotidyltransferase n=1 Tax=Halocalculus aciditolerans TaxID=1383812 RepID=A0A830F206_9EURY|nr:nucleotidyltransferase domain-containing protein [Halocalculus aciditolerans]GGL54309.1 hypothetical protein GCM10009039_10580 [Halocalculus aciditolerans]
MTETPPAVARALDELADKHEVRVVLAREVGSRAWGLAGPASDHDVGVVFAQAPVEYAQLGTATESVHEAFAGVDVKAWNVTRLAELVVESNPTVLEFLGSDVEYVEAVDADALAEHAHANFVPIDLYHHYRSLATRQHEKYVRSGTDATVSRNLHLARAGLYARYVLATHAFPALDVPRFLDDEATALAVSEGVLDRVRDLVARKHAGEGGVEVGDPFPELATELPGHVDPDVHNVRGIDVDVVNAFVARCVEAVQTS